MSSFNNNRDNHDSWDTIEIIPQENTGKPDPSCKLNETVEQENTWGAPPPKEKESRLTRFLIITSVCLICGVLSIYLIIDYVSVETGKSSEEISENFKNYIYYLTHRHLNSVHIPPEELNKYPYVPECDGLNEYSESKRFDDCHRKLYQAIGVENEYDRRLTTDQRNKNRCLHSMLMGFKYDDYDSRCYYKKYCLHMEHDVVDECNSLH